MALTLWHRDRLLGTLFIRPPSRYPSRPRPDKGPTISAVLLPSDSRGPDAGLWQLRIPFPTDRLPQFQHIPIEPDIVAERDTRHQSLSSSGTVALHPLTEEERGRIRPVPGLTLRDDAGRVYLPRQLRLEEIRMEPVHFEEALREIPRDALIGNSIWSVFAAFDLGADAPAT